MDISLKYEISYQSLNVVRCMNEWMLAKSKERKTKSDCNDKWLFGSRIQGAFC